MDNRHATGHGKDSDELARLLSAIQSTDWATASSASEALVLEGSRIVPDLISLATTAKVPGEASARILVALGRIRDTRASRVLEEALSSEDHSVRFAAALALTDMRDPTTAHALLTALKDADDSIGIAVVRALGAIGDIVIPLLHGAMSDPEEEVRKRIALTLERIGGSEAGQLLIAMLSDASPLVRSVVTQCLGNLREKQAVAALVERLRDEHSWVRGAAALALGQIGDQSALPHLRLLADRADMELDDEGDTVSSDAAWAVKKLNVGSLT